MRRSSCVAASLAVLVAGACQPVDDSVNPIRALEPGLYAMDFAGSHGKSTIVELADGLAMLELPIVDQGAEAQVLEDHPAAAERALRSLARRFPDKPLRYVLSSHWHPHSLSALAPLVAAGVQLVTTRSSYARLAEMAPGLTPSGVIFVDGDTLELGDHRDPAHQIIAHRFTRHDYPATPTDEYLYFELPGHDAVHVGCMYSKWDGPPVAGRPLITAREDDLFKLLTARGLAPRWLIRIDREPGGDERLPFARLADVVRIGVRSRELADRYRALPAATLTADAARIAAQVADDGIPPSIFNTLAYDAAAAHDLARAVAFARLQAALAPASANTWDTLGEMCFFAGDVGLARGYAVAAHWLDPASGGGEPVWQADLAHYRATLVHNNPDPRSAHDRP